MGLQGFSLKALRHLVLDEADRLLNMDFEQEIDQILKSVPRDRRTQLFSATMTSKVGSTCTASTVAACQAGSSTPGQVIHERGLHLGSEA